ncbi:MAG: glycosyltransferase family 39 protein [Candidatus Hydrogenedentes bacterium]|nr:glycosyltransferase family 39 protein [Candidatus Hydrogenedentota bacterium]
MFEISLEGRMAAGVGLALVALSFTAYSRVLLNGFIGYDDDLYVTQNPVVQSGLTAHGLYYALTGVCSSNWHPVTMLSHILDCTLFGLNPAGHHLTSLVLHSANTLLLYLVLRRMTGALWPSALVALLFAVHPLHIASVAHVSQRKDVLSTAFWLLTTLAYLRYTRIGSARWYAASLTLYLAGLLAKPMLVTLPLTLLLLDWWPLGRLDLTGLSREDQRRRIIALVREKIPFFLLAFGISVVTVTSK